MSSQTHTTTQTKEAVQKRQPPTPTKQGPAAVTQPVDLAVLQRAIADPGHAGPRDILALQRTAGNHAVTHLLQARLTVGPPGDQYEQEADRVAEQVMNMTVSSPVAPGEAGREPQPVQRQGPEEEEVQTKPLAASITPLVQRQAEEEEEVQMKPLLQRQAEEEEEVQTKPLVQRQEGEEEEPIQGKPLAQRAIQNPEAGFETSDDLARRLAANRGGGSPLPSEVRAYMEPRFGTDFSGVRVHTGGEAVQMNRELSAQAFTHGQDIYMGEGKYYPNSDAGKQLLAHELTHVVQQTHPAVSGPITSAAESIAPDTAVQRRLTPKQERQVESDIRAVEQAMGRMNWSGSYGPSVTVETPLKWENEACRRLYLDLKGTYDDQQIPGTHLYYYFGAIGNWGKAGFRITGHTKKRAGLQGGKEVKTAGVLHVENS